MAETEGTVSTAESQVNATETQQGQQAVQGGNGSHEANNAQGEQGISPEIMQYLQNQIKAAVTAERKKWDMGIQTQLSNAKSEGERLAKMSKEERRAEEDRIERENYKRDKAKLERDKMEYETSKILADKNLSPKFAKFLAQKDAETTNANIDEFEKAWNEEHQRRVDTLLAGTPPKHTGGGSGEPSGSENILAKQLGERAGKRAEQSRNVLNHYLGN